MIDKIRAFAKLEKGWDSYNADPPSEYAIQSALFVYDLMAIKPDVVHPSVVGGIGFIWRELHIFAEIYQDGSIYSVLNYSDKDNEPIIEREMATTLFNKVGAELVKRLGDLSDNYKEKIISDFQVALNIPQLKQGTL